MGIDRISSRVAKNKDYSMKCVLKDMVLGFFFGLI